jgi:trk system potassium uptake protein TrkH
MVDLRFVVNVLGWIILMTALAMAVPGVVDLMADRPRDARWFLLTMGGALFVGVLAILATRQKPAAQPTLKQAFLIAATGWVMVALVGAVPFLSLGIGVTNAIFESMSGITTTGSTVLIGLDDLPPGLLLWRALLQWVGGIGILALAILILPLLRVGGMQLFRIESSDSSDLKAGAAKRTVAALFFIYLGLTGLCALLYWKFGMSGFDAITHAMATLATGGYSTHDASFGYFRELALLWIGTAFMILGSLPFLLYVRALTGAVGPLLRDSQIRVFLVFLTLVTVGQGVSLSVRNGVPFWEALTLAAFNITSVVTTTGFSAEDYTAWGPGSVGLFFLLTIVGGCSGSTSGGMKIYRFQILALVVGAQIRQLISPHRVLPLVYNRQVLRPDVPPSVLAFAALLITTIAVVTLLLTMMGLDLDTAMSASVTAIANVGPGLGEVGPSGTFQHLPEGAKWLLILAMLAGRLEILPLLVVLSPSFWRR